TYALPLQATPQPAITQHSAAGLPPALLPPAGYHAHAAAGEQPATAFTRTSPASLSIRWLAPRHSSLRRNKTASAAANGPLQSSTAKPALAFCLPPFAAQAARRPAGRTRR
ncbi:hypothetical protein NPIL_524801, partial [Nephila pilipes]